MGGPPRLTFHTLRQILGRRITQGVLGFASTINLVVTRSPSAMSRLLTSVVFVCLIAVQTYTDTDDLKLRLRQAYLYPDHCVGCASSSTRRILIATFIPLHLSSLMPRHCSVVSLTLLSMLHNVAGGYSLFTIPQRQEFRNKRSFGRAPELPFHSTLRGGASDEPSAVESVVSLDDSVEPTREIVHDAIPTTQLGPKAPAPGLVRSLFPRFPWRRVPDYLTYLRCFAIPLLAWSFFLPGRHIETASIFALASLTDFLDGYLARRWDVTSSFGAFLDPVADKLAVSTALILLSGRYGGTVSVPTSIILGRELAVSALREWMAQRGQRDTVQVGFQGKVKTALSMVSLTLYLAIPVGGAEKPIQLLKAAQGLLCLSAALTVTSGWVYFRAAAHALRE